MPTVARGAGRLPWRRGLTPRRSARAPDRRLRLRRRRADRPARAARAAARTRTSSTSPTRPASRTATADADRARALRAADRRGAAGARREAARGGLQLGDGGGAAGAARAHGADDARRRRARRRPARGGPGRRGHDATGASGCWRRRPRWPAARTRRRIAQADPFVELTAVACPDLRADHRGRLPVRRAGRRHRARLRRAAARGGRRHGDPRLHALPARRADAPAHARPRRADRHLRRARSPTRSSTCSGRAASPARTSARATTASCATGDVEAFRALGTRFLQLPLGEVEHVTLHAGGGGGMSERSDGRAPDELRPDRHRAGLRGHGDRLGADRAPARRA